MHPGQLDIGAATVTALVAAQFPHWTALTVRPVRSHGTVNQLFRLGRDLVLRFPLEDGGPAENQLRLETEADAARRLLGRLPVPTPEPVAVGEPGPGYPLPWMVYRWLPGTVADRAGVAQSEHFAHDLAGVVLVLRSMDTEGRRFAGDRRILRPDLPRPGGGHDRHRRPPTPVGASAGHSTTRPGRVDAR